MNLHQTKPTIKSNTVRLSEYVSLICNKLHTNNFKCQTGLIRLYLFVTEEERNTKYTEKAK